MDKLAIDGGKPVRDTLLAYGRQDIDKNDIDAVVEALKSDYLTTGPNVADFEKEFARYVGSKYAAAVSNGTAALHAAVFAAGIGIGDEVITTPMTFAASANCVLYMGAKPVFADILPDTYNINPDEIRKKITGNTKAIIPVDFTGQPANYAEILKIAKENNLFVIEDAAHSLGAEYKGQKVGSYSDMTTFSFHPVKHITTGEGGMITTNDEKLYKKLSLFRTHGITRNEEFMEENQGNWYYEQIELGFNYRITDIQCALGRSQLKKLDSFVKRRRELVSFYNNKFEDLDCVQLQKEYDGCKSSWHLYILKLDPKMLKTGRKDVFDALRAENIGVNVHYLPVYLHPYYRRLGYEKGICPAAEDLYENIFTLPLYPAMSEVDAQDVVDAVEKVLNFYHI
jgi:perosamine synthetase